MIQRNRKVSHVLKLEELRQLKLYYLEQFTDLMWILSNYPWHICSIHGVCVVSHVPLFATPWTGASQAPLFMEFSRQEYWSGLLFPSSGNLPHQEIETTSPALQVYSLLLSPWGSPLFTELEQITLKFIWGHKRPRITISIPRKKERIRRQVVLQSHSNQNSIILVQNRYMGQWNREPRNKATNLWSIKLQQRRQEYTLGKGQSLQQVVLEKLDSHMHLNEVRTRLLTIHKNKLKMV